MTTLEIDSNNDPIIAAVLKSLSEHHLVCSGSRIENGRVTLDLESVAPRRGEEVSAGADLIHHKHDNIAAAVQQPREDLLQDEPQGPMPAYGRALGGLMEDPATKDVAKLLIAPLLERGLRIEGNQAKALSKVAHEFKDLSASKLSFAAQYLLKGKHELFPDFEEIYAAIGRYKPSPKPSAADPAAHVNGVQV